MHMWAEALQIISHSPTNEPWLPNYLEYLAQLPTLRLRYLMEGGMPFYITLNLMPYFVLGGARIILSTLPYESVPRKVRKS